MGKSKPKNVSRKVVKIQAVNGNTITAPFKTGLFKKVTTSSVQLEESKAGYRKTLYDCLQTVAHAAVVMKDLETEWNQCVKHPYWKYQKRKPPKTTPSFRKRLRFLIRLALNVSSRNDAKKASKYAISIAAHLESGVPVLELSDKLSRKGRGIEASSKRTPFRPSGLTTKDYAGMLGYEAKDLSEDEVAEIALMKANDRETKLSENNNYKKRAEKFASNVYGKLLSGAVICFKSGKVPSVVRKAKRGDVFNVDIKLLTSSSYRQFEVVKVKRVPK